MPPPARCLDLTRLVSRQGRGPLTGIDRVELAYLRHLLRAPQPLYALVRTRFGFLLLDEDGARAALDRFEGRAQWGKSDLLGRLSLRAHPMKRRAEADLRRRAVARCRHGALGRALLAKLPPGTVYFNTGHSNLADDTLAAWRALPDARIAVLIHDTIPLDHPQFQRPGTVFSFREKLSRTAAHADVVICTAEATKTDVSRWMAALGGAPRTLVAPLGIDAARPDPAHIPADLSLTKPFFVALGTIEPRKNHALLLDVWDALGPDAPYLLIAGRRGWRSEQVFSRLDKIAALNGRVIERPDLDDAAVAALLRQSNGLLFPSMAEGYGLPPLEAAALGVPVVCSDLPVIRELLGDKVVYLPPDDVYLWKKTVIELAGHGRADHDKADAALKLPAWDAHFNRILNVS